MSDDTHSNKSLLLHVGTDKTGSTALQALFFSNEAALGRFGYTYLRSGRDQHASHILIHRQSRDGDFSGWREIAKELEDSPAPGGLVSFEGFYHFDENQLLQIREQLGDLPVRIVIYLRRQSDKVRSGVAQRIKQGRFNLPLHQYSAKNLAELCTSYTHVLHRFAAVFGRENIIVRRYERSRWPEGNIFLDFLDAIGLTLDSQQLSELFRLPDRDPNPTLDIESIHLLDILDALGIDEERRQSVVRLLLSDTGDDRSTFVSDELAEQIDAEHAESNSAVARDWFGEEKLFTEPTKFVYRQPDFARLGRCIYHLHYWIPLLSVPVWPGERRKIHTLVQNGAIFLQGDWVQVPNGLRLENPSGRIAFRIPISMRSDILLKLEARWAAPAKLRITVNGLKLYEGPNASRLVRVPYLIVSQRARIVDMLIETESLDSGQPPIFALDALGYSAP